jgi:hypothetical protein
MLLSFMEAFKRAFAEALKRALSFESMLPPPCFCSKSAQAADKKADSSFGLQKSAQEYVSKGVSRM